MTVFNNVLCFTKGSGGNGDVGADPNKLVAVRDILANTSTSGAAREKFVALRSAGFAEVLRGVSFTSGTEQDQRF